MNACRFIFCVQAAVQKKAATSSRKNSTPAAAKQPRGTVNSDATKDNSTYKAVKSKSPSDTGADAFQEALLGKIGAVAQEMGTSNQVLSTLSSHMGTMTLQLGTLINFSMGAQAAHGTAGAALGTAGAAPSVQATPSSEVDAQAHVGSGGSDGTKS